MDSAKFGDFTLSRFSFIVRTDRQNNRITDTARRFTYETVVSMSNYSVSNRLTGMTVTKTM